MALYLIFIRYASKFFAVITVFNTIMIMPFYLSGAYGMDCTKIIDIKNDKPAICVCQSETDANTC